MFFSAANESPPSSQPDGLNEEELGNFRHRTHSALEKGSHISSSCTSDTSSSSYRSAPSSSESFKDCVEYLEKAGDDHVMQRTYCDSEYEQAVSILSTDQTKLADREKISTVTVSQPHKALNHFGSSDKGKRETLASGDIHIHFPSNRSKTIAGSTPVQGVRGESKQANLPKAIKDQSWRGKLCFSGKESQQVQMSIKAKNNSDPVCSGRMGLVTQRLQPGDCGSKFLDHPAQFSADKSKEMLPNSCKLKMSSLASRPHGPVSSKVACPQYFVEHSSVLSDSDEADNEVEQFTAVSFQSLSCPQGSYLDMYSSSNRTSSSLSNSLPEDCNGMNRWPACSDQRKTTVVGHSKENWQFPPGTAPETELLSGVLENEHFECIDLRQENADGKKSLSKKRTVPKRQIQLRRKDKKETGFCVPGECASLQSLTHSRKDMCAKRQNITDEFRINYKQFLKAASLSNDYNKTKIASDLVKNVLSKKMQYEQRIKTEQGSLQTSSPSSIPSSISTDLQGDSLEGKSSPLSKSDCSFSTEDVQSHSTTSERSEPIVMNKDSQDALRPTKGVVLNKQLRENVYKLKNTFNELNERMKYQEAIPLNRLPVLAEGGVNGLESNNIRKQACGKRKEYWRARAMFESMQDDSKSLPLVPRFAKSQKPWPNLKQRAIQQNKHAQAEKELFPLKPSGLVVPQNTSRNTFISKTKEMKLKPQVKINSNVLNAFRHTSWDRVSTKRLPTFRTMKLSSIMLPASEKSNCPGGAVTEETTQMQDKGNTRINQLRDIKKVKGTYNPVFKPSGSPRADQNSYLEEVESKNLKVFSKESTATSPLFIHCTSICRKDFIQPENHIQREKQDHFGGLDMSALSLQEGSTQSREFSDEFHPLVQTPKKVSSQCFTAGESAVHITTIHSKKLTAENKEFQPLLEKKLLPYERSEFNVRPSTPTKKESQLDINISSKQLHTTKMDYFPGLSCATTDYDWSMKQTPPQSNHNLLRENKAIATSEIIVIPPATYVQEITRRDNSCTTKSRILEPCKEYETEQLYQKHLCSETFSVAQKGSKDYSILSKEENMLPDSTPPCESSRHPKPIRSPMRNTQSIQTQTPGTNMFVDRISEQTALDSRPRISSESAISDNAVAAREYIEGIKLVSNSLFTPSSSCGKLPDSGCDYVNNNHQAINEQYHSATQADNTNYLTIPVKTHQPEPSLKQLPLLHTDTSFTSNVCFQPGLETSGNKMSSELFSPKQMERSAPTDNLLYNNPCHGQLPLRPEESPSFTKKNERISPSGKTAPSPTRHVAAALQAHRKMLVDPESGKCYYVESPRQPQLKMLYDPETGQYIEVLIPPVPLASQCGLYQAPFPSAVMNPGNYGQPYLSYSGCPDFPPPPVPPVHLDLQDQHPAQGNANFSDCLDHFAKHEAPSAPDGNYMESLYYIPTGMNSSPNPSQASFPPPTGSGPLHRI